MTDDTSSEILNPGKKTFDFPALSVTAQFSAILCSWLDAVASVGSNHFNTLVRVHLFIQCAAVIGFVANEFFENFVDKPSFF